MFELSVPENVLLVAGPQRSGKTTALTHLIMATSRNFGVVVIGRPEILRHIRGEIPEWAIGTNVYCHSIFDNNEVLIDEHDTVVLLETVEFIQPGKVGIHTKPSDSVIKVFDKLSKEKVKRYVFLEIEIDTSSTKELPDM